VKRWLAVAMTRSRTLLLCSVFIVANIVAEGAAAENAAEKEASANSAALLDDIAAGLRAHTITRGHFSQQKTLPILTQPLLSSGSFIYDASRGVLWQVEKPVSSRLVIGPSGLYQDGKLQASGGAAAMVQNIFQGLLSGDLQALQSQFVINGEAVRGDGERKRWQLTLMPRGEPLSKAIASIVLSGASEAEQLTIRELQGSVTQLQLFDQNHPATLTPAEQQLFITDGSRHD
jgi:hypothetical protein